MFAGLFGSNSAKENAASKANPQRRLSTTATSKPPVIISKPPFPHPLPHTQVRVVCSKDGLILSGSRDQADALSSRAVLISYGKAAATSLVEDHDPTLDLKATYCTSHGCLGILRLFDESYLLLITSKKRVGRYAENHSKRIYSLTGVTAIPLSNPASARDALDRAKSGQQRKGKRSGAASSSSSSSDASDISTTGSDEESSQGDVTVNLGDSLQASVSSLKQDPEQLDKAITEGFSEIAKEEPALDPPEDSVTSTLKSTKPASNYGLGKFFWSSKARTENGKTSQLVDWAGTATPSATPAAAVDVEVAASAMLKDQAANDVRMPSSKKTDAEAENLKALDKKILRELTTELTSGGFFFSQDYDLTSCMQAKWQALQTDTGGGVKAQHMGEEHQTHHKSHAGHKHKSLIDISSEEPRASEPLAQRAERRFWYNRWLSRDLVQAGATDFVTVLMQGYVQRRRVSLRPARSQSGTESHTPSETDVLKLEMLIISRRSVERPGLRYQRRGVNQAGGVANFVETEFIMSTHIAGKHHMTSYVQTRGSIPLFWSQSPWSLKPVPVLEREEKDNREALSKHFERQVKQYFGAVHIVNLAETTGKEGLLVAAYRDGVAKLGRPEVVYNEWDFHHMCKGMRYERISLLIEDLAPQISHMSSFWVMDRQDLATQRGVMRVNCMDCLDRTNVVESAFARKHVLTVLEHLGVHDLASGSREALDVAFNELWANNGDAISREYAGTSALKGDFVRSGKRNWLGQFNDATNSVARYWQNTVLDFFKQAMIDYVLGINTNAFLEFSEKMQTSDPGEITRLASIREAAVDNAASAVLADDEQKLYGWTLISPATCGQIRDQTFEEKILILSAKALYACSYEYTLQKVRDFTRIPLGQIVGIQQGEYILSALDASARNIEENYGFCIRYLPEGVVERSRTYSIRNTVSAEGSGKVDASTSEEVLQLAFKAVRKDLIRDLEHVASPTTVTSRVQVLDIVDHIRQACEDIGATSPENDKFVEEKPIISLAEAKAQVSFLDKLNYEVKNLIWL